VSRVLSPRLGNTTPSTFAERCIPGPFLTVGLVGVAGGLDWLAIFFAGGLYETPPNIDTSTELKCPEQRLGDRLTLSLLILVHIVFPFLDYVLCKFVDFLARVLA